jgi:precorrin-2/cobalt-factor-2 C20-methyltransferase
MNDNGIFYGVGVGTGDPELLTLKAVRLIQEADSIVYLLSKKGTSIARDIARQWITTQQQMAIIMPYRIDRNAANIAYDKAAKQIADDLKQGLMVVFLCEGDPLFFGSYIYLQQRLMPYYRCEIVAGISSIHTATALAKIPLTQQNETLAIVTSRNTDEEILNALDNYSSVIIMKAGVARARLLDLIRQAKRLDHSCYIERAGQEGEVVVRDIAQLVGKGDYFSLFLIH